MDLTNTEPNAATPTTKSDQETSLNEHSVGKVSLHTSSQKSLSHSSSTGSSPDSPLVDDPFNSDDDDDNKSFSSNESAHKRAHIPVFETNVGPANDSVLSTEAPCSQTMERADSSAYRIPPSVFASNAQAGDWSVASNESLFSINGGNASFRNDPFWRSGDLGAPGHKASPSDHMFIYSVQQQSSCAESMMTHELGLAQATMKEVIRESESYHTDRNHDATALHVVSISSNGGSTSTKSFAFSIKAESQGGGLSRAPSSVRSLPEERATSSEQTADRHISQYPPQLPQVTAVPPTHNHDQKTDLAKSAAHPKRWSKWSWSFLSRCSLW